MSKATIWIGLAAVLLAVLLGGCEPTDWDLIIDPPEPVTNMSASGPSGGSTSLTYTLPVFPSQYDPDKEGFTVLVYYRAVGGTTETYVTSRLHPASAASTTVVSSVTPGLSGADYVFIVYNTDRESQRSAPAESNATNWPQSAGFVTSSRRPPVMRSRASSDMGTPEPAVPAAG